MHFSRHPRLSRILILLAVFQMFAPSVAAIADAWRMDQREPYAHMESESTSSCVVVHAHDCALCSVANGPTGTVGVASPPLPRCAASAPVVNAPTIARVSTRLRAAPPRGPPTSLS